MRKISFLFLFLLITLSATAQTDDNMPRRLTISGQVMDAEFREPMAQATIQLFTVTDSVFVGGTVSDNRGNFSVEAPNNGTFRLKISSVVPDHSARCDLAPWSEPGTRYVADVAREHHVEGGGHHRSCSAGDCQERYPRLQS